MFVWGCRYLIGYDVGQEDGKTGFFSGATCACRWVVQIDMVTHHIEILHGQQSGRKRIYFDDELVLQTQTDLFDEGLDHGLPTIGGVEMRVMM